MFIWKKKIRLTLRICIWVVLSISGIYSEIERLHDKRKNEENKNQMRNTK